MYSYMLFLHILGVLIMFAAVGTLFFGMINMLHAKDTPSLKVWAKLAVKMDSFLPISVILILFPALYLVMTTWGWDVAWINVSLAALIIMTLAGPIINLSRLKAIAAAVASETNDTPSKAVQQIVRNEVLWCSGTIMMVEVLGIVYLMVVKPALVGSIVTLIVCACIGVIVAKLALKRGALPTVSPTQPIE